MSKESVLSRCSWCENNEIYMKYHDDEWGVPIYDDLILFEYLTLEGAQAGLNWLTILKKRENYRIAFDGFNAEKIVMFSKKRIDKLLQNSGIIRNKLKISSVISNARAFLKMKEEFGSFSNYQWQFIDGSPIVNTWDTITQLPQSTKISEQFSKDLRKRGFKFVGPIIMYSYMQAIGMVNDHLTDCFRYAEINHDLKL